MPSLASATAAGWVAGTLEISVTFPFEYIKTQMQLQQEASALFAGKDRFRSPFHCAAATVRERGALGLYRGGLSWALFGGPRSAVRFGTFETLTAASQRRGMHQRLGTPTADAINGFAAGMAEAALCQTPNQVIAIKMIHDQSPRGPCQYEGLAHCVACIWRAEGVGGFFQGVGPAVTKGAATNAIRFLGFGQLKRLAQGPAGADGAPPPPLATWQAMLCGGIAGAVSAVATQPIDTVKANMMGIDGGRYRSAVHCTTELVRAGGFRVLMNGVGPRVCRVFVEVGLQFSLYEYVGRALDRAFGT